MIGTNYASDWEWPNVGAVADPIPAGRITTGMSSWKLLVNFLLPPPLILTFLLVLPTPNYIRKGLLIFIRKILFFKIAGEFKLVHVMLFITGFALFASSVNTYRIAQEVDPKLTPNQRIGILARKWREERNFWITTFTFLLWGLLYRFYTLMLEHAQLKDRCSTLESLVGAGGAANTAPTVKGPAPKAPNTPHYTTTEASAPPMPHDMARAAAAGAGNASELKKDI